MSGSRDLRGRCVLVVEDEFFIADDIRTALVRAGAEVLGPVATRQDGLAIVAGAARIDCAVLDINLGGELCFPVADALMKRRVPFVFATGYEQAAVPDRYARVPRWEKPFDLSAVVRALPALAADGEPAEGRS